MGGGYFTGDVTQMRRQVTTVLDIGKVTLNKQKKKREDI